MSRFYIRIGHDGGALSCPLCAQELQELDGPLLCAKDNSSPVCRPCGQRHAPALAALLDLARMACQVGKISRHARLWVPMETLLQLERAAGNYAAALVFGRNTT